MIIATAGHVDHGKSALLEALTGVDPMHLPEEKRRGMTIDIGFAFLPLANETRLAFVDVPGHEKFLSNMLVGVGGVQHALLVIACDDGVMAQTREHLAILKLLHIEHLIVVLSKADRVDASMLEQRQREVKDWLNAAGFTHFPIFITAVPTGFGIAELRDYLMQLADADRPDADHRFRLAIDRVFHVQGAGIVVTGTALAGSVAVDDTLWLTGADMPVRVRGLHAQNQITRLAHKGQRVALNITANKLERQAISRGDWLLEVEPPEPAARVLVALEVEAAASFKQGHLLIAHHAASHTPARVALIESEHNLAELSLNTPFYLTENDRLILRDAGNQQLLGAARVLSLTPPRRGKRLPTFIEWLQDKDRSADDREALYLALRQAVVEREAFAWARQLRPAALTALFDNATDLLQHDHYLLTAAQCEARCQRLLETLAQFHQHSPDASGVGQARLARMALPNEPASLLDFYTARLLADGRLARHNGWLHLPDHSISFNEREKIIWERALPLFAGAPCWVRDIAQALSVPEIEMRALLVKAARLGLTTAIVRDRYYLSEQLVHFANLIRNGQGNNAQALRDTLGIGRKLAIQILEYFDRCGFTRRVGDEHVLRDAELFQDQGSGIRNQESDVRNQ